jgi:CheY-like chemotaxis protein
MPKLDGISVTRQVRALDANKSHTPIVALTAHATDDVFRKYEEAGADLILTKPISLDRLRTALLKVFNAE